MKMIDKIKSFFSILFLNWKAEENLIKQCNRMTPLHRKVSIFISCIFLVFTLIVWLCAFPSSAEESISPLADVPTDLTGYTINVPSGWTTDGISQGFLLDGSITVQGLTGTFRSSDFIIPSSPLNFWLSISEGVVNEIGLYLNEFPNNQSTVFSNSYGFSLNLNYSVDSSNSSLIQWLVDNDAVFIDNNPDPNPLVTFNKGLYRVNYFWYQSDISTQLDGMEFYSLNEGDLYTSINVQNDQLIFDEDNGDMHVMARYTSTGAKWVDNSGQFVYFINDESIPQSLAEQIPTLLEYIPDVSLTEFQRMQDSWYYGVLDGYSGGYTQATNDTQGTFLGNIFGGVFDALDKFQMFGQFSFLDFIKSIIGILALIWLLKLLAGG